LPIREKWRFELDAEYASLLTVTDKTVYVGGSPFLYAIDAETGEEEWRFRTKEKKAVYAPVKAGSAVFFGSGSYVYAVDAESGEEEWKYEIQGKYASGSPIVEDGIVYIGGDGYLYAIDAQFGEEKWRYRTDGTAGTPALDREM